MFQWGTKHASAFLRAKRCAVPARRLAFEVPLTAVFVSYMPQRLGENGGLVCGAPLVVALFALGT